ncbi:MAG: DUF5110 domain-containing protein [Mediterranea sp.]|jgi:hypothetical protein|nr:DUF5110 domain-containing protein [Mediterranea sp.]
MKRKNWVLCLLLWPLLTQAAQTDDKGTRVTDVRRINPTTVEIRLADGNRMSMDFYGENIFRLFQDNSGGIVRDPQATPPARILVDNPRRALSKLEVSDGDNTASIATGEVRVDIDKATSLFRVTNLLTGTVAMEETATPLFEKGKTTVTLREQPQEYFYGGGVQNGRFSHKGKAIAIENQNSWTDGGVASPTPFYWSTGGYAVMWYTFKKGRYDFGATERGTVRLAHETDYLDLFVMVGDGAVALLNDFYQLTGQPVLIPKFGFYQGHLNAYNRDYWTEDQKGGTLFEDGKRYKESQKDNGGIKESLNGEKNNYQFSARAVIDRYRTHDMPLGWLLPNDGYGAGYGQTETLDGNIQNLKSLGDYARQHGVEIGLWTQSDLHPKAGVSALLQRDIVKEVRDAGVRVLKTDVAWVGAGYSFGLNGVADVGHIMPYYGNDARPFIISLDGWAGTQRYAGVWTGDQTGGKWEYIRFHIPTYIGSGLSGQPNICSDMDGIFGGKNLVVNTRDFQWKAFTPMQLNMDGWGSNEKYPHALGEPATSINRWYLKLKSELMPYAYSVAHEAVDGLPMIRAMFLVEPNAYTHGISTRYQFLYGPDLLVAPIYQNTRADAEGNDIRDGIYLPKGSWIDLFTGERYEGECVVNNFDAPLWKLPVLVRDGAIVPLANPSNHVGEIDKGLRIYAIYPNGKNAFREYDDDGLTEAYRRGRSVSTLIEAEADDKANVTVTIHPTEGDFDGFVRMKRTEFRMNASKAPRKITASVCGQRVKLRQATSLDDFNRGEDNAYFYDTTPNLNRFATAGSAFANRVITGFPRLLVKLEKADVTAGTTTLRVEGFENRPVSKLLSHVGTLVPPQAGVPSSQAGAYTLRPSWQPVPGADYYELMFDGMRYTTIKDTTLLFDNLSPETDYSFQARSVNKEGTSPWATFGARTKSNPLEFAIQGIRGETSVANQGGFGIKNMFNFSETGDGIWHTRYQANAIPFDLTMDLVKVCTLDKFHYLPRPDAGNGTLLKGSVAYSMDKEHWTEAGNFEWKRDGETKVFTFAQHPTARYIRLHVTEGVGNYGSGRELYVFRVPGTPVYLQGDINADGRVDENDFTSYTNYTGLREGDSDFDGYISNGDINKNGLIDAYDISVVATQLEDGVSARTVEPVAGSIELLPNKRSLRAGETLEITVKGTDLRSVNAFSFALPYNQQDYEYVGLDSLNVGKMENLTYDRLHGNGTKALYPTFVNVGNKPALGGTANLFIIKLRAKRNVRFTLQAIDGLLVDKTLNGIKNQEN